MMRRVFMMILLLACIGGIMPVGAIAAVGAVKFKDVNDSHWAKATIEQAVAQGYVNGYPDGTFRPSNTITRAEVASMLSRVTKMKPDTVSEAFADSDKHWSKEAVRKLVSLGFIKSADYPKGFEPDKAITRYELMKWLASGLGESESSLKQALVDTKDTLLPTPESFKGGIAKEQVPYIALVRGTGVVNGFPDGSFKPGEKANRAEVLTMMMRYAQVEGTKAEGYRDLQEMIDVSLKGMNSVLIKEIKFSSKSLRFKDIENKNFDFKSSDIKLHRIILVDGRTSEYKGVYAPLFVGKSKNDNVGRVIAFTNMTFTFQGDKPYKGSMSIEVLAQIRDKSNMMELNRVDWENANEKHIPTFPLVNTVQFVLPNKPVNIWVQNPMLVGSSYYVTSGNEKLFLTIMPQ